MAKRMKLVPESLYKKFMRMDEDHEDHLKSSKSSVLSADLPDDIKAIMYQDYVRQLREKKTSDENIPQLVKIMSTLASSTVQAPTAQVSTMAQTPYIKSSPSTTSSRS